MTDEPRKAGDDSPLEPVRIGRSGTWLGLVLGLALVLVPVVYLALTRSTNIAPFAYVWLAGGAVLFVLVVHGRDVLVIDDDGLLVRSRKGEERYLWTDVLEVAWLDTLWPYAGSGPLVRVEGGPWDVPGPNAPVQIAKLPIFGRRSRNRARNALSDACRRRGVPFSRKATRMATQPRPGSPLRRDRDRPRWWKRHEPRASGPKGPS